MPGPLDGIRVVEMAVIHVGPPIGYILGDLGAEVLKIERPDGGDPTRSKGTFWFDAVNRNKKSVTLDLKKESGREALYRLVGRADVFVSNFHTALLERLGADYETLSGINSRLVYGHVGAWGPLGKDKDRRAFEALVQARSGFTAMISGGLEAEPLLLEGGLFDQNTGTVMTYGILAALVNRERTGGGQMVQGSLLGSAMHFQHGAVNYALWSERFPDLNLPPGEGSPLHARNDRSKTTSLLYNWYQCADGRWLMFCEPDPDRWWEEFCNAIGARELAATSPQDEGWAGLMGQLDEIFAKKTLAEWVNTLEEAGLGMAYSPVNSMAELAADPQVRANNYVTDIDHPTRGRIPAAGVPLAFSGTPVGRVAAAPGLGEHNEEVMTGVGGFSAEEFARLKEDGAFG